MAMLVVLLEVDRGDVPLGPRAVGRLARLGVTNVALLRDEQTVCMVLEGWRSILSDRPARSSRRSQ